MCRVIIFHMENDKPGAEPDLEKQAEAILRAQGLTADSQPIGVNPSHRRLIYLAIFFVVFCLALTFMTYLFKP